MISDAVLVAVIVAAPATLTAIGGIIIGILADRRSDSKLDHITELTNSTLTEATKHIVRLKTEVAHLKKEIKDKK